MKNKLIVVMDGGLVQCIVGTGALVGASVTVIDYDTDGSDEDELTPVKQADGDTTDAHVRTEIVEAATIPCDDFPALHDIPADPVAAARAALEALAYARDCLKVAGATRAADKVRLALSSAKGAVRHAKGKAVR